MTNVTHSVFVGYDIVPALNLIKISHLLFLSHENYMPLLKVSLYFDVHTSTDCIIPKPLLNVVRHMIKFNLKKSNQMKTKKNKH